MERSNRHAAERRLQSGETRTVPGKHELQRSHLAGGEYSEMWQCEHGVQPAGRQGYNYRYRPWPVKVRLWKQTNDSDSTCTRLKSR
jgi:hypothetical protein